MSSPSGTHDDRSLAEKLAVSTARLEQLVSQIMNEIDHPVKYELLASEVWRVLREIEHLREIDTCANS
jgi:hypothetical protein